MKLFAIVFGISKTVMFLCIMAILCSCKDTKKILTRNSYQYWHYIDSKQNEDETRHPYFCREDSFYFYVDSKGVFIEFRANWRFREYNGFLVSHYLYEPSWNLLNRNTIRFGRFRYKIISVSDNRILIRNDIDPQNAVDTLELVPKSHIPKDYRDFQKPFQYKEEKKIERKVNISLYFRIVKIISAYEEIIFCIFMLTSCSFKKDIMVSYLYDGVETPFSVEPKKFDSDFQHYKVDMSYIPKNEFDSIYNGFKKQ